MVFILQGLHECGLITGVDLRMFTGVQYLLMGVELERLRPNVCTCACLYLRNRQTSGINYIAIRRHCWEM